MGIPSWFMYVFDGTSPVEMDDDLGLPMATSILANLDVFSAILPVFAPHETPSLSVDIKAHRIFQG